MKSTRVTVIFIMSGFVILNATDKDLLQKFMNNNLVRRREPVGLVGPGRHPIPIEQNSTSEGNVSTLPPPFSSHPPLPPLCPKEVNISWQLRPPYTLERNDTDDQTHIDGIFHQVLDFALERCCAFYQERKPILRYLAVSPNASALLRNIFNEDVSVVLPIHKDQHIGYRRNYINIIDSPGVVLIQRNPSYSIKENHHLFKAILTAWPIVVLSILMSCLAGIFIWMLVSWSPIKKQSIQKSKERNY